MIRDRSLPIFAEEEQHDVFGESQDGRLGNDVVQGNIGSLRGFGGEQPRDRGEQQLGADLLLHAGNGLGVELALGEVIALEQLEELLDDPLSAVTLGRSLIGTLLQRASVTTENRRSLCARGITARVAA